MVAIIITIIYMNNKVFLELWPEPTLFSLLWKIQRDPQHGLFSRALTQQSWRIPTVFPLLIAFKSFLPQSLGVTSVPYVPPIVTQ